jgi:hypothetical protein
MAQTKAVLALTVCAALARKQEFEEQWAEAAYPMSMSGIIFEKRNCSFVKIDLPKLDLGGSPRRRLEALPKVRSVFPIP